MISNPKNGWCNFKLGDFEGTPSYITDVPIDLLDIRQLPILSRK